jgi:hypothetical protein
MTPESRACRYCAQKISRIFDGETAWSPVLHIASPIFQTRAPILMLVAASESGGSELSEAAIAS